MSTTDTTRQALAQHVAFVVKDLLSISEGTYYEFDPECNDNALEAWMEAQLSVEFIGKRTFSNSWEITSVEIVSTTGGPHVEVVWDRTGLVPIKVNGYWGGQKVSEWADCPELEAHLEELTDLIKYT